jgi:REP element-mobilizing transposase RayT
MARLCRHYVPGLVHHAIARFHSGEFRLSDREERDEYLRRLASGLAKSDWKLLAFALMSSHIHLVVLAGLIAPRSLFQPVHSGFALWLNRRQQRRGQLFAERYKLWTIRRPVGQLIAYVHNNPVRAGVVEDALASDWTSHTYYCARQASPPWLSLDVGLELSGFRRRDCFDAYVRSMTDTSRDTRWSGDEDSIALGAVRARSGAAVEASDPDVSDVSSYKVLLRPGGFAEIRSEYSPEQVVDAVASVVGLAARHFRGRCKQREAVRARRLALRIWRSVRGPQVEMSGALGMSNSAACGLLASCATHHSLEDEDRVWAELLRRYPQGI